MGKAELKIAVDDEALAKARAKGVDLTQVAQAAVDQAVRDLTDEEEAQKWAEQNAVAIKAHRERIDKYGVFGEDLRTW
jgi:antitoxin CcdA